MGLMGGSLLLFYAGNIVFFSLALNNHVKRLHDLGHSGWWVLLFIVPLINILLLLYLFFFRGQMGGNQYGPDPITGSQERILAGIEKAARITEVAKDDRFGDGNSLTLFSAALKDDNFWATPTQKLFMELE